MTTIQDYLIAYFGTLAKKINNNPALLAGMQDGIGGGRSILVMLEDQGDAASGLLLDAQGSIRVVDPGSVNPTLTVVTRYQPFMDIMDGKQDVETAFSFNMVNVYGARFLADYLVVKDFIERLIQAARS